MKDLNEFYDWLRKTGYLYTTSLEYLKDLYNMYKNSVKSAQVETPSVGNKKNEEKKCNTEGGCCKYLEGYEQCNICSDYY